MPLGKISDADRRFVLEDLVPLRYKAGLAAAPYLQGLTTMTDGEYRKPVFYACRHFDQAARACTNYENRPPVCREYPLYGGDTVKLGAALPEGCVYS